MAAISVNDGGTWRTPWGIYVNDGGTWRTVQQVYVNDGGTWRTVFIYEKINTTMTESSGTDGANIYYGFFNGSSSIGVGGAFGSLGSATTPDGAVVDLLADYDAGVSYLIIGGFLADPGVSYFSTCTVGGVSKTSASVSSYDYGVVGAGMARWTWASQFGLDGSGTSAVLIA